MTSLPDDTTLTHCGLSDTEAGYTRVVVIACGALAREILSVRKQLGTDAFHLTCLPAILHNHPDKITDAVRAKVAELRPRFDTIYVAYADCGTGGLLQAACDDLGVEMIAGPHCYSFFEGNDTFEARDEMTAFYLTDFLVRQFDAFVWTPLGLDRHPALRDMYFGHYSKLVYQAQTNDPKLTELAKTCADRLGLVFERRFTGYGDLERALTRWVTTGDGAG